MTALSRRVPINRLGRRLAHGLRTLFAPGDGFALVVALALLLAPLFSLTAAGWPLALNTIIPVVALSLGLGFLLARSHYNELFALLMAGLYGLGAVLLIAAINEPGDLAEGAVSMIGRTARWLNDAVTGGINQDELIFTMLVSALFWFLGYNAAWHLFRVDRVWRVILPPGLILISNTLYYTGSANLEAYIFVYIFLALLLVVRSTLDARAWDWYVSGIRVPRSIQKHFFRVGIVLGLAALLIAAALPSRDIQERLNRFREFLQTEPLTQLSEVWNRLFSTVETQGPTTSDYYGGDSLQLGGAIRLGEQTVMLVQAPQGRRYFWRSRVLDTYANGRWTPGANVRLRVETAPLTVIYEPENLNARAAVQQQFTLALNASRLIYAAPQPYQVDLPTRTDLLYTPNREAMNVSVIRPLRALRQGDSYTVTSLLSDASAAQLRAAPGIYPDWINRLYLQVPPSITDRVRQLAQQIVTSANASTPYDRAKAIENWLRNNILYNEIIPPPPATLDPVEWVLFEMREGYCNYYATAMVMLLRTLGVPARLAAGFAQGAYDGEQNVYVVRERDAHTWVEVYFPGYGWIEFEPTAAQAPLNRVDDAPAGLLPSATPAVTPTPTATPTPTPTPTPDPATPQPQGLAQAPSITPTFTPSPTATPVIVPTQPPPITPRQPSLLQLALQALGVALLVILALLLLVALLALLYWWWEWRGMRGLSPITRAYARLERYLSLIGIRPQAQQTPDERRRQIVRVIPKAEPPVTAITRMYTAERYGRGARSEAEAEVQAEMADAAWTDTRGAILRRFLRRLLPWARGR